MYVGKKGNNMNNYIGNTMIIMGFIVVIAIIIFIALIVAIFEINSNIKVIKDYLLKNEYIEGRRLEPKEDWIYENEKKSEPIEDWIYK